MPVHIQQPLWIPAQPRGARCTLAAEMCTMTLRFVIPLAGLLLLFGLKDCCCTLYLQCSLADSCALLPNCVIVLANKHSFEHNKGFDCMGGQGERGGGEKGAQETCCRQALL